MTSWSPSHSPCGFVLSSLSSCFPCGVRLRNRRLVPWLQRSVSFSYASLCGYALLLCSCSQVANPLPRTLASKTRLHLRPVLCTTSLLPSSWFLPQWLLLHVSIFMVGPAHINPPTVAPAEVLTGPRSLYLWPRHISHHSPLFQSDFNNLCSATVCTKCQMAAIEQLKKHRRYMHANRT